MKLKTVRNADTETLKFSRLVGAALLAREGGADLQATFDSATSEAVDKPANFVALLDKIEGGKEQEVLAAVFDGVDHYTAVNGEGPGPDLIASAIQQGLAVYDPRDAAGHKLFDSATSNAHDQISLQANRAVTAIIRTIAEGCPWAGYLPIDIGSNQAKLIIAQTLAGSNLGSYTAGDSLEGINLGKPYALASRTATLVLASGTYSAQFFTRNLSTGEPNTGATALSILRGRTIVYVNGIPVGYEAPNSNGAASTSPINGSVVINGTTYTVAGTSTPATGAVAVTLTPALADSVLTAEAFIDYDKQPGLIPLVNVEAVSYDLFATESRIYTANAYGAATQMRNEAGVDPEALATAKFRDQHTMERHYKSARQARAMGFFNNKEVFDFQFAARGTQLVRAQIVQDLAATIGKASQKMANDTQDHGITHLLVGNFFAAILDGCPSNIWKPSGLKARAGVYRKGRLFDMYEVYYYPDVVQEAVNGATSEIICVGTSTQAGRNPFVFGDAVAPTLIPLATNPDLKRQAAMYSRDFAQMNPHIVSARGCALIQLINLI